MTIAISGTTGITLDGQFNSASSFGFKNRIINGAMVIDQRNAGASVTPSSSYTLDRWRVFTSQASKLTVQQNAGSVTPPTGFTNYLGVTSSSAYTVGAGDYFFLNQNIEGFNSADLQWGTANAQTVTLSFRVYSSLTGTFGGSIENSASTRAYPFSYSIPVANTWTTISITIPGDTTGTWIGATNGIGLQVALSLGVGSTYSGTAGAWVGADYRSVTSTVSVVGTNGATFYITGVQLEKGSTATSFDYRPYGTELALCQRYFSKSYSTNTAVGGTGDDGKTTFFVGTNTTNPLYIYQKFPVSMRAVPTMTIYDLAGTSGKIYKGANGKTVNTVYGTTEGVDIGTDDATNANALYYFWTASSEL